MRNKYLVIVYPAPPATRSPNVHSANYGDLKVPSVKWITASSAERAAEEVGVVPGGYALVIRERDAQRFDRPARADLVQKTAAGELLPEERAA